MGLNPFRPHVSRRSDILLVGAALLVVAALVLWAFFGLISIAAVDTPDLEVRHIQPYQALKAYRCPGCDHEIPPGLGHEVVVPRDSPADRRHWHSSCWHRATKSRRPTHS